MSGLSVGILSGLVVATVGVAAVSLSTPLPPRAGMEIVGDGPASGAGDPVVDPVAREEPDGVAPAAAVEDATDEPAPVDAAPVEPAADPAPAQEVPAESAAPATEIPLPAGTEFNRPPPEPEAALPSAETAPAGSAPQAPALASDVTAPTLDTSTAAQPAVGADAPAALSLSADPGAAPASPASDLAPASAVGPAALSQPDASTTPDVDTTLSAPVEDAVAEAVSPDVVGDDLGEDVAEAEPDAVIAVVTPEPEAVPLQTPRFPSIGDGSGEAELTLPQTPQAPPDGVAALRSPGFPRTSDLPQAIPGAEPATEDVVEAPASEEQPTIEDGPLPAIRAFAAEFDADDTRPLLAVVLIDEPDGRIDVSTLTRFTFPVAFAIDPLQPDAAARAAQYRAAGFEVVILGSMIVDGATATDVEVALSAAQEILPEAVAVLDTPESRIQADRPVLDAVVGALAESGHGLVAFPRGLNAAEQSANRLGVPGATVFRLLDDENQRATVITRFLGRAEFSAAQEGAVIVVGHTRPDTVTALFSWALGSRSEGVALAPLSATIERAAGR